MMEPTSLSSQCKCKAESVNVRYREGREFSIFAQEFSLARAGEKEKDGEDSRWMEDGPGSWSPGVFAGSARVERPQRCAQLSSLLKRYPTPEIVRIKRG